MRKLHQLPILVHKRPRKTQNNLSWPPEKQVPKSSEVGETTKEPTGSAKPEEEAEPSAPSIEEILKHYEEESKFCGTRSYTMEIPVGDEVRVVEAVGKIFLEEVKVSLT
jgi:hypothetical protein